MRLLPDEIILIILSFTRPLDIVERARLVSKLFREITYDRGLWKLVYTRTPLPRPPGPYPSQSAQFLERTLVRSARLEKGWTGELQITRKGVIGTRQPALSRQTSVVCGRWLIYCQYSMLATLKIIAYDIEKSHSQTYIRLLGPLLLLWYWLTTAQQIIWEGGRAWKELIPVCWRSIGCWDACSIMSVDSEEEFIYVVICETPFFEFTPLTWRWKLVEFTVHKDSGQPVFRDCWNIVEKDSPATTLGLSGVDLRCGHSNNSTLLSIVSKDFAYIFDTKSRILYELPPPSPDDMNIGSYARKISFTRTHILVRYLHYAVGWTHVQAFVLPHNPSPQDSRASLLRLTHECSVTGRNRNWSNTLLLRDSVVDPLTGSINIRFLHHFENGGHLTAFTCITFTLPPSTLNSNGVVPMLMAVHPIFTLPMGTSDTSSGSHLTFVEGSSEGYIRGFFHTCNPDAFLVANLVKFTIDATKERCSAKVSRVHTLCDSNVLVDYQSTDQAWVWFDGVRGRVCCHRRVSQPWDWFDVRPHVVDIK